MEVIFLSDLVEVDEGVLLYHAVEIRCNLTQDLIETEDWKLLKAELVGNEKPTLLQIRFLGWLKVLVRNARCWQLGLEDVDKRGIDLMT
jgi:hypothetical protein